jgi:DNA adenine methylase
LNGRVAPQLSPFLKWAGGKRWLGEQHPSLFDVKFDRFIEPFLGSGAVFFRLAPSRAILSDRNPGLILTYRVIRDSWQDVVRLLRRHHRRHCTEYYYLVRAKRFRSNVEKAAQFIYLNRTCWNGLYRVNRAGTFNVPIGTKSNVILESDDFEKVADLLAGAELEPCDFQDTLDRARAGDFVFVDPPYTIKHNHNGFIKYNEGLFSWDDQVRLRDSVLAAHRRGAKILVTNASHRCIRELYSRIGEHVRINRSSVIAGDARARGNFEEMVIKCL